MTRQADYPNIVTEILAPELRPDPHIAAQFMHNRFHFQIAEAMTILTALRWQPVKIAATGQLHCFQIKFSRRAANHDSQVIGRTGSRSQGPDLLIQEFDQTLTLQQGRGALKQECLVGRPAALGNEQEFIGILSPLRIQLNLARQIVAGVLFFEHGERGNLTIAKIIVIIGIQDPFGERGFILSIGPDTPPLLAHHDGGAGILAHRQHTARRNIGILQKVIGDETIIVGRFRVIQNLRQLRQMARPQQVINVAKRFFRQQAQPFRVDRDDLFPLELCG